MKPKREPLTIDQREAQVECGLWVEAVERLRRMEKDNGN